jgi:hypothetical protein
MRVDRRILLTLPFCLISSFALCQSSNPSAETTADRFAICNVRQQVIEITKVKVAAQASASCDTGGGGVKSCQVSVGTTANDYVLDNSDVRNACYKLPDGGDNPCAFVQYGPVVFASESSATQLFITNSGRVTVQLNIGQFKREKTLKSDTITQPDFKLIVGKQFTVRRTNVANSTVSLDCQKADGESFTNFIPGNDNSGGKIKQISVENGGAFDLYVFQVLP